MSRSRAALSLLALVTSLAQAAPFSLSSPTVAANATLSSHQVFKGFGCSGDNVSPALQWQGAPAGTASFAVTMYDPDAPTGSGWWHWVVFNLPASTQSLALGAGDVHSGRMPATAIQSRTDFGVPGYGGPCPPLGDKPHRYIFTVYALKIDHLPLQADSPAAMVGYFLHQNALGQASLQAYYGR